MMANVDWVPDPNFHPEDTDTLADYQRSMFLDLTRPLLAQVWRANFSYVRLGARFGCYLFVEANHRLHPSSRQQQRILPRTSPSTPSSERIGQALWFRRVGTVDEDEMVGRTHDLGSDHDVCRDVVGAPVWE
jgi:hypothetical protein